MSGREKARQIVRSAPYFPVPDVAAAASHYETVLGFSREYVADDPPQFAIMSRDGFPIMLRLVSGSTPVVPNERQGGSWDVFFWINDAQSLYEELVANGADIVYGPVIRAEYQMKELAVRDRDGYILGFGQDWSG
jgi:predicted enzyme related to lactoylglutathione lyase